MVRRIREQGRRRRLRVVGVVAVLLALLGVTGYLNDRWLALDLLRTDFERTVEPFTEAGTPAFGATRVGDTYRMRVFDPDGGKRSFAALIRLVPGVDVRAEVVEIIGTGSDDAETGLQCAAGENEGYYFTAGTRGGYRLGRLDRQGETVLAEDPTVRIPPPGQIRSLRLVCEEDATGARVWASVNGRVLGMVRDAPGFGGYSHVALMFRSPKAGAEVRFGDVLARAPARAPGLER